MSLLPPAGLLRRNAWLVFFPLVLALLGAVSARAQSPVINSLTAPRQTVTIGQSLTLSVSASSATSYQWKRRGLPLSGATSASYSLSSASPARDTGWYQVVVTNGSGSTASAAIFVNVVVPTTQALGWGFSTFLYPPGLAQVSAIALTEIHGMAVLADGSLFRWGGVNFPESPPPSGLSGVVAVAGSWQHSLALKSDGTVVAWGLYQSEVVLGPAGPVAGLTNVVAISDAMAHSMALRRDGTVAVWTAGTLSAELAAPAGLTNVVSIAAGARYCLAAKADGTVVGWGEAGTPGLVVPAGLAGVVSVHAGTYGAAALKSDGTVVTWSTDASAAYAPPAGLTGVVALAAGGGHFYALKNDGSTAFWGVLFRWGLSPVYAEFANVQLVAASQYNVAGVANAAGRSAPTVVNFSGSITLRPGGSTTLSVAAVGAAPLSYRWQRRAAAASSFVDVPYSPAVYAGDRTATLTISGATLAMHGDAFRCVVSNGISPEAVAPEATVNVLAAPVFTSEAQVAFGLNRAGLFTVTASADPVPSFAIVSGSFPDWATFDSTTGEISGTPSSKAGSPWKFTIAANNDPDATPTLQEFTLTVVGAPTFSALPAARQTVVSRRTLTLPVTAADAAAYQWKRNGRAIPGATFATLTLPDSNAWRDNGWYQLGATNAFGVSAASPVIFVNVVATPPSLETWGVGYGTLPTGLSGVSAISGGNTHAVALKGDGTVVTWGSTSAGPITPPSGLVEVVAICAVGSESLALKSDGTVAAWGAVTAINAVPAGLTGVVQVALGSVHAVALKSDGTVVVWGSNNAGQLNVPAGLSSIIGIAAGIEHNLALRADGTVVAWGSNDYGASTVPAGLRNVVSVASSIGHSLAIKDDATIVEWGNTFWSGTYRPTDLTAVALVPGLGHCLALKPDGTVTGWGSNSSGELNFTNAGLRIVGTAPTAGGTVLLRDGTSAPVVTTSPSTQVKAPGQTATFTIIATGTAPLLYQWQRQPAGTTGFTDLAASAIYSGVTTATLAVIGTTSVMSGDQFRCVVGNDIGTPATSAAATLWVNAAPAFTTPATATFFINRPASFTVIASGTPAPTFTASGLPAWATLNATTGLIGGTAPDASGAPFLFTLTASNGIGSPVTQFFTLTLRLAHSADVSPADGALNLVELMRVIELYNARAGTVRTGRYVAATNTVDGYAPSTASSGSAPTAPHSADLDQDGRISLTELTRVIELYNVRLGSTRHGAYHSDASTPDGFAPGL